MSYCAPKKEKPMSDHSISIEVKCKNNPGCLFDGEDIFIEIFIINKGSSDVGYPLEFAKEKGPSVRLIDTETKNESSLSTHLADWDLKEEFTTIKPGASVSFEWVITDEELKQFGHKYVDLTVEVGLADSIRYKGEIVEFSGTGTTRIVSKDKPKEPTPQF
ncbi:MAG TPA: hypothetical protein DEP46_16720 [Blastocatellia bacterium]|nr:hypothetical protein [Blastocatellia bacterium]